MPGVRRYAGSICPERESGQPGDSSPEPSVTVTGIRDSPDFKIIVAFPSPDCTIPQSLPHQIFSRRRRRQGARFRCLYKLHFDWS